MKYVLITGASGGIGFAMAEYCASKGFNLVLSARSGDKLSETACYLSKKYKVEVHFYTADLLDCNTPQNILSWCYDNNFEINALINNAGVGLYGRFSEKDIMTQLNLVNLNVMATLKMTHLFLPMLKKQEASYIMNVSGTCGYQPIPYMSVYAATHSFLQSFSLGLREELKKTNVSVSCLCPGPTATDFFERAGLENLPVSSSEVKMRPLEVATIAIEGMLHKIPEIIPGANNTIGAYISKILPNPWIVKTVSSLFSPQAA